MNFQDQTKEIAVRYGMYEGCREYLTVKN